MEGCVGSAVAQIGARNKMGDGEERSEASDGPKGEEKSIVGDDWRIAEKTMLGTIAEKWRTWKKQLR